MNDYKENEKFEVIEENDEELVNIEYDITSYPSDHTLRGLYDMFCNGDITIPDYQRGFVWSIKQSSLLIESFLIGLPVPPIFFYIDEENKNLVIDGQQRLMSIVYFIKGFFGEEDKTGKRQVFKLSGLKESNKYYSKTFIDLDSKDKRRLENSVLRAINIRQLSPIGESTCVYHIFERLNTGGTPLKSQEIRNCVFKSDFLNQLKKLNTKDEWRTILGKKNIVRNQTDVELILRVFGLAYDVNNYEKPMKEFLNKVAKRNMKCSDKMNEFSDRFLRTCSVIVTQLRPKPFNVRGPFNMSIFDSVFCTILNNIDNLPQDLSDRYEKLVADVKFIELTTIGTTLERSSSVISSAIETATSKCCFTTSTSLTSSTFVIFTLSILTVDASSLKNFILSTPSLRVTVNVAVSKFG